MGGSQRNKRDPVTDDAGLSGSGEERRAAPAGKSRSASGASKSRERRHEVPRWRQIEIMRERKALQELLDDFGDHDFALEDEIFGFGANQDVYFRSAAEEDDEVAPPLDEDDFPDDEFEED